MLRSPRVKNAPHKYSPSQPTLYSQENYLLRFEDNNELVVVKRSSIRSIIEDKAIVGTGSKRRFATIEAKGTYTECNNMYEYLKGEEENDDNDEENQINDQEEEDDDQMNESKSPDAIPKEPIVTKKRKLSSLIVEDNDGKYIEEENITSSKTQKDVSKKKTSKCFHDDFKYKYNVLHLESDRLSDNSIVRNDVLVNQNQNNEENETIQRVLYTPEELSSSILPPDRSHLARPALDPQRFGIFHEAVRVKYRISVLHYDTCYSKLIRPRMCDFLIDERKRQKKALAKKLIQIQEQNINNDI
ncbi:hypothetical protein I4U23_031560 [Adineta vaga]|nr:hypothetical protein I4U23_031560 [Adineta vaga]